MENLEETVFVSLYGIHHEGFNGVSKRNPWKKLEELRPLAKVP